MHHLLRAKHAAKYISYVDVKNEWGDSKIDYIIKAKSGLLKFREVSVNASLHLAVFPSPYVSALAIDRNGRTMDQLGFRSAQEQDDLGNLFRLGPLGKISG